MSRHAFEKVAIANRGEVAVRIIHACQELGLETVLLHSEADQNTLAYRLADEKVCIGASPSADSYLNIEANIAGAKSAGADAIHPGFGFLSENADFAEACANNKIKFIGPSPEAIRLFGDKVSAKKMAESLNIPLIPGYKGDDQSIATLMAKCKEIGFPVMVKAAAGGGGRGLKVIRKDSEARELIESAQREGQSAFGSSKVFLEKYMDRAKHIEVQIFGDAAGQVFHLGERECSVQRRHQKIVEESPSAMLDDHLRNEILAVAVKLAEKARYQGAGTVEFLVQDGQFYFMEMNTRLQVEHPVTEMVMGVDLVKAQLITAQGIALNWKQNFSVRGASIECRIYAEDPYKSGIPSTGVLGGCLWPQGAGRRFEVGFEEGDEVTSFYDSMIAKVIVWDENRPRAIQKMKTTLRETIVFGLKTNIPYLLEILDHPEFRDGSMTTRFIDENFPKGLEASELTSTEQKIAQQLKSNLISDATGAVTSAASPWLHSWGDR